MDFSDSIWIALAFMEKLPNSIRINKMIRKIRKVVPIILNSVFKAFAVNSRIFAGWIRVEN